MHTVWTDMVELSCLLFTPRHFMSVRTLHSPFPSRKRPASREVGSDRWKWYASHLSYLRLIHVSFGDYWKRIKCKWDEDGRSKRRCKEAGIISPMLRGSYHSSFVALLRTSVPGWTLQSWGVNETISNGMRLNP